MILVKDLIEWAKQNAIGRSVSYPDGAIRSMDLLRLATDCLDADPMTYKPPKEEEQKNMGTDTYMVLIDKSIVAMALILEHAVVLVKALFNEYYAEPGLTISIQRKPKEDA